MLEKTHRHDQRHDYLINVNPGKTLTSLQNPRITKSSQTINP